MKKILLLFLILPISISLAQKLGEMAPEKERTVFPENSWGVDIMFGEGGFGFGTFLRKDLSENLTGFADISFSESTDEREIEYIDYFGRKFVIGKENRVLVLPINIGLQYRLFDEILTDNLRPYIGAGVGPTFVFTTPYSLEFFESLGKAQTNIAAGGYIGFGANFGLNKKNLVGINIRYYFVHLFNDGVESLKGRFRKDLGSLFLTLNIGIMY